MITAIENEGYSVVRTDAVSWSTILTCGVIAVLFGLFDHFGLLNYLVPGQLGNSEMGYGMLFIIGLMTSVHCIAMCGGINLSQSLPQKAQETSVKRSLPTLRYNLGRVISYTAIGFLLGLIGMLVTGSTTEGLSTLLQGILKGIAGVCMVVMGINMLGIFPALRRIRLPSVFSAKMGNRLTGQRPLVVGLLNGLMPCGPLQSMQIVAFASGNPLTGALAMFFFALGTVPLMLGFGTLVSMLGKRFAGQVTRVGAVLVTVLGFAMLSQGASLSGIIPTSVLPFAVLLLCGGGILCAIPAQNRSARLLCTAGLLVLCLGLCQGRTSQTATAENVAQMQGDKQVVTSTLESGSYPDISVTAGTPVEWIIRAPEGTINGCNYKILIPEYGIEYEFHEGDNKITFTPTRTGAFSYSCWMGMIHGEIQVSEA